MHDHDHDHDHDRTVKPMVDEITDFEVLEIALRELCIEKGIFTAEERTAQVAQSYGSQMELDVEGMAQSVPVGKAQAAAPTAIVLDNLDVVALGALPLYLGPGVTKVTVSGSRFRGETTATALYLDAESAENRIIGNRFAVRTTRREQVAVDGSARNVISGNVFEDAVNGGIFLYRNAGEGGTIRHQPPQYNRIEGNRFHYEGMVRPRPAIWLNQRNGRTIHRLSAPDLPLGSSLDPRDLARHNVVRGNRISGGWKGLIRNTDPSNEIVGND